MRQPSFLANLLQTTALIELKGPHAILYPHPDRKFPALPTRLPAWLATRIHPITGGTMFVIE